jgi:hypothetical protein
MQAPLEMITTVRRNRITECPNREGNVRHRWISKSHKDYAGGAIYVLPMDPTNPI